MDTIKRYHWVIGLLLLAFVIIAMLGSPDTFLGKGAFIYSDLDDPTGNQAFVRTTLDFGSELELQDLPLEVSDWRGADYEETGLKDQLGAETMLLRAYTRPGLYQPLFFLAMQSKNKSSFHPPKVCYSAAGWMIREETDETVEISEAFWENPSSVYGDSDKIITLPANRMVVDKTTAPGEFERRVVLYFYVKPTAFGAKSDEVTMIRVSAVAPVDGSYQEILDIEKELVVDFLPLMFEPREERELIFISLATGGALGILALVGLFAIPLGLIFYPQILRSLRRQ